MTIKYKKDPWSEALLIETPSGTAKVYATWSEIKIDGESILKEYKISVSDAIAMFFDQAASQQTRERFKTYLK